MIRINHQIYQANDHIHQIGNKQKLFDLPKQDPQNKQQSKIPDYQVIITNNTRLNSQNILISMKTDKSKQQFFKLTPTSELLKKELSIQRQANKNYQKFKKSASQPAYFLNKSRLKKISDIYRAISLQKLSKNHSLNKSKSLHTSVTPQKKPSGYSTSFFTKKQNCVNTLNLNKMLDTNEKTKRLRLDRTIQNQMSSNAFEVINQNATKFLNSQVDKLEEIANLKMEKAFVEQYDHFFRGIKQECFKKGCNAEIKVVVSRFCYLMELCQQKMINLKEKQIKSKYDKIELDFSNTNTQLKKKNLKMQLLIKQIDQLKAHNMKISNELNELRQQKKSSFGSQKSMGNQGKKRLQITHMIDIRVHEDQTEISTPVYGQNFEGKSSQEEDSSSRDIKYLQKNEFLQQHNHNQQFSQKDSAPMPVSQKIQMIKRIRALQKKQKDLVKTLMILRNDGIDVQKAFNQVTSGQANDLQLNQDSLRLPKPHTPSHIKHMPLTDSYQADNSIIDSIDGLTVRYFDGEPQEEYAIYPIKHEYKSKPLDEVLQNKLKLNFDILYDDYEVYVEEESQEHVQQYQQPPTI